MWKFLKVKHRIDQDMIYLGQLLYVREETFRR